VQVQEPCILITRVPEAVHEQRRRGDARAGRDPHGAVADPELHRAAEDVEDVRMRRVRMGSNGTPAGRPGSEEPVDLREQHLLAARDDRAARGQLRSQLPRRSLGVVRVAHRPNDGDPVRARARDVGDRLGVDAADREPRNP